MHAGIAVRTSVSCGYAALVAEKLRFSDSQLRPLRGYAAAESWLKAISKDLRPLALGGGIAAQMRVPHSQRSTASPQIGRRSREGAAPFLNGSRKGMLTISPPDQIVVGYQRFVFEWAIVPLAGGGEQVIVGVLDQSGADRV